MRYHLGCGSVYLAGYYNVDFPMENHTVNKDIRVDEYANILTMNMKKCDEIRSNHVFEHFNYVDSLYLLYKWYLALNIKGILNIRLPDLEALTKALINASIEKSFRVVRYMYGSHEDSWAYHINGWTSKTLPYVLKSIGFTIKDIITSGDVNSDYPNCSLEVVGIKEQEKGEEEVKKSIVNLFQLYKAGNVEFENNLDKFLQNSFLERCKT